MSNALLSRVTLCRNNREIVYLVYHRVDLIALGRHCALFSEPLPAPVVNLCVPSPCGPYSECRDIGGVPSCSCSPNYMGSPPNCRPECTINPDCPSNRVCMGEKCRDPCPGSCGVGAICSAIRHTPMCSCPEGFTGDPFTNCEPVRPQCKTFNQDVIQSFFQDSFIRRLL